MLVLDTGHVSLIARPDGRNGARLIANLDERSRGEETVTTIVTFDEQLRVWLAYAARARGVEAEAEGYGRLSQFVEFHRRTPTVASDRPAAIRHQHLRSLNLGVGTLDLRIAAIALENGATPPSRNPRDFREVLTLSVEDWSA